MKFFIHVKTIENGFTHFFFFLYYSNGMNHSGRSEVIKINLLHYHCLRSCLLEGGLGGHGGGRRRNLGPHIDHYHTLDRY